MNAPRSRSGSTRPLAERSRRSACGSSGSGNDVGARVVLSLPRAGPPSSARSRPAPSGPGRVAGSSLAYSWAHRTVIGHLRVVVMPPSGSCTGKGCGTQVDVVGAQVERPRQAVGARRGLAARGDGIRARCRCQPKSIGSRPGTSDLGRVQPRSCCSGVVWSTTITSNPARSRTSHAVVDVVAEVVRRVRRRAGSRRRSHGIRCALGARRRSRKSACRPSRAARTAADGRAGRHTSSKSSTIARSRSRRAAARTPELDRVGGDLAQGRRRSRPPGRGSPRRRRTERAEAAVDAFGDGR